ncbi:protein OPI10 homolog [Ruditapes philippinarum]|uniref:protein OPI10 homolog n=1 Tax=Ruditapes philippinarum TaxID=129788 RepID=UPI00295A9688|nr:protein OPI10 homolog [Ruditapes philippinarum]
MSASQMFGIIVSGRLVQTDAQQVSENQILFNIPDADSINHIVVFMTGQVPFPDGLGGAVYFSWPSSAGQSWLLLGHISNVKPSAIFKITNLKSSDSNNSSHPFGQMEPQSHLAQIGISVEPLTELSQQTPATLTKTANVEPFVEFSKTMCENLFNYASSFTQTQAQMVPNPNEMFVPLSKLQQWYENFLRRLQQNPYFWRS